MLQFERHSLENVANLIREEENTMSEVEKVINKAKKSNGIIRKLDELGRIVIPKDYRKGKVVDRETKVAIWC